MCLLPAATPIQERIASDRSEVAHAVSSSLNAVRRVRLAMSAFLIELVRTKDIRTNKVLSTSLETKMHRLLRALEQVPSTDSWTHQLEDLALDDQYAYDTQAHSVHGVASDTSHLVDVSRRRNGAPIHSPIPSEVPTAALREHGDADHNQEDLHFAPTEVFVDDEGDALHATMDEADLFTTFPVRHRYAADNTTVVGYKSVPFHGEDVRLWRQQRLAHLLPTVAEKIVGPSDQLGKRFHSRSKTSPKATAHEMDDDTSDKTPDFWGEVLNPSSWPHISPPTTPPPSNVATAVFGEHSDGYDHSVCDDLARIKLT
ncbi:hypothetical protein AaE_006522, partial [Aphanomyces astaci]